MKQTLLLTWLLLTAALLQAQTKLAFEETLPEAYLIKKGTSGTPSQNNINSIINLLQGNMATQRGGRPNRVPEFVVRFSQQARIADLGDKLQLKVMLHKFSVTGDVLYKGFDIGEVLYPERLTYKIKLLQGQQVLKTYTETVTWGKAELVLLDVTVPDTTAGARYRLVVEEKELQYTGTSLNRVQEHLNLIRDYYAADLTINTALQNVSRIQPNDVDRIMQHDRNLREMEDQFANLRAAPFHKRLNLKKTDPQGLSTRLNQLEQQLQERRKAITFAISTLDQQFYNRGASLLAGGNRRAAQEYFLKSVEVNRNFAPSHLELARIDFMNGYISEATSRTRDLLTQMRIDPQTQQLALGLAHDIYSTYINEGNQLTSRGDYHHAMAAFGEARAMCSTIGGLRCNLPALNDGEGRAVYGAYRSIIDEGKRLLATNNLTGAERVAGEALAFQKQHDFVLHEAQEAPQLMSQVKYQYYVQYIDKGKMYLSERNYGTALSQFEAALEMERSYGFQRVPELGQLAQRAAKPVLLANLSQGYEQAMNNRLSDARAMASAAVAMQSRYALEHDTEVQSKYNQLRDRISTQECLNNQAAYDGHLQQAKELVREKKYLAADQAYAAAISVAERNATCSIPTFTATYGREEIAAAVTYQHMLDDINRFVGSSRYTEAIQRYNEAEKYYLGHEINRFGLNHISLYNFARNNTKQPFTATVANYFASRGDEAIAIQLLTTLLDKGYGTGKTKKLQQQLGLQLAQKDVQLGVQENPKLTAAQHTLNHKKLKQLAKSYEKERKRLGKS
ncbi:tetratricopeptide repeat protein [Pontibacter beigongshangensis]|uniref:hypothetical protein n=1 Tax=Pontibacter beigongshangensis TaxID=2574733 RepID=UPI0016503180|nr:hypothetical protein [Pontibacter beigongshangensis]